MTLINLRKLEMLIKLMFTHIPLILKTNKSFESIHKTIEILFQEKIGNEKLF